MECLYNDASCELFLVIYGVFCKPHQLHLWRTYIRSLEPEEDINTNM